MSIEFNFPPDALEKLLAWTEKYISDGPNPTHGAMSFEELDPVLGKSITEEGIGADQAFNLFSETILPSTRPFGHPTSLSFVASAPTKAALGFDAALGASGIFAGNWDGGSGAIHAENQVLRWLADLARWPDTAGGVFVAGGTLGNLSALHAARTRFRDRTGFSKRLAILSSSEAHSSIVAVAQVMDVDIITAPTDKTGRLTAALAKGLMADNVFAVVANGGATNCGAIDDIKGLAALAKTYHAWLHIDGAYGGAALASPYLRDAFDGIEEADSLIVDPHKWLFAPYDSCALVYRDAADGKAAHGQRAVYLDVLDKAQWNPSDYALHLTRRARGLPLWYSLATHGTNAYAKAITKTRQIAEDVASGIDSMPWLDLLIGPQLTVILFRARGMSECEMMQWAETNRRSGALLCLPTQWRGEPVFRLCFVNPNTDPDEVLSVLKTLQ